MIKVYGAVSALLFLASGGSAYGADLTTIDCVSQTLDAATVESIKADFFARMGGARKGHPDLSPRKGGASDPEVRAKIDAAAMQCGERHGWSEAAKLAAIDYGVTKLGVPAFESPVNRARIDPARIAAVVKGLPDGVREAMRHAPIPRGALQAVYQALVAAGLPMATTKQQMDVMGLSEWLIELESARLDFIAA